MADKGTIYILQLPGYNNFIRTTIPLDELRSAMPEFVLTEGQHYEPNTVIVNVRLKKKKGRVS